MKIQCDVCETVEAAVLCCADEAALCWACDKKIHAANKLAGKHQRVPLLTSIPHLPKCDICQEKAGYFFCLEDRALLCRQCDVTIHTASPYVRAHQRFLVTGVKVSLQQSGVPAVPPEPSAAALLSTCTGSSSSTSTPPLLTSCSQYNLQKCTAGVLLLPGEMAMAEGYGSGAPEMRPHWPLDEILTAAGEFDHGCEFPLMGSSSRDSSQ